MISLIDIIDTIHLDKMDCQLTIDQQPLVHILEATQWLENNTEKFSGSRISLPKILRMSERQKMLSLAKYQQRHSIQSHEEFVKVHLPFEFLFESLQDQEVFANTMRALGIHVSISSE